MLLTETQQKTLEAVVDRLIPPDDYPGAWAAGVGNYLQRQFASDLQGAVPTYQQGLEALETESEARFGTPFPGLETDNQDSLLRDIEAGNVQTSWGVPPQRFFSLLVAHTAEGYYSDPGNGGNRNALSWQMIGFLDR